MRNLLLAACAALALSAGSATAGPTLSFSLNQSDVSQLAGGIGTVTLTQNGTNAVDVMVDLKPLGTGSNYGFINSGGLTHTPFAFNLANMAGLTIAFSKPTGGNFQNSGNFSFVLNTAGGTATPFGAFSGAIDITPVQNGANTAYFGDLAFTLTRTSGLSTTDFIQNNTINKAYFAADIANLAGNTGTVASTAPIPTSVPEPTTIALLGAGMAGIGMLTRKRRAAEPTHA